MKSQTCALYFDCDQIKRKLHTTGCEECPLALKMVRD